MAVHIDAVPVANEDVPELVDPLTSPSSPYRVAFTLAAGASFATMERSARSGRKTTAYSGPRISAAFGYRRRRGALRIGLQLDAATLSGTTSGADPQDVGFSSLALGPFFQARLEGPFWFGGAAGLRLEEDPALHVGGQLGLQLGLDLTRIKYGWLVLLARYDLVWMPDATYGELTVAAALRR